jgi:hypothetical protein
MIRWTCPRSKQALALAVVAATLAAASLAPRTPAGAPPLFTPIATVLLHPRCMNCHSVGEASRGSQGRLRHDRLVAAAAAAQGTTALPCASCHQAANSADGAVPGARNWRAAPASMGWDGLSPRQICEAIKDPSKNGNRRTLDAVIDHMRIAPLVLWSWNPGAGREVPPVSHDAFVHDLEAWAAAGAPCPIGS